MMKATGARTPAYPDLLLPHANTCARTHPLRGTEADGLDIVVWEDAVNGAYSQEVRVVAVAPAAAPVHADEAFLAGIPADIARDVLIPVGVRVLDVAGGKAPTRPCREA